MTDINGVETKLTEFTHDLFTSPIYIQWLDKLHEQKPSRWYSLIVELDKTTGSIQELKDLGESIYSKLVYRCIPTPDFKNSKEIMVLFNVSGGIWHSLIYYSKNQRNKGIE